MCPFTKPKPKQFDASPGMISDIIETCLRLHPDDCVFAENARERAIDLVMATAPKSRQEVVRAITSAIQAQEIYCPHEGIDRRLEFGMAPPINPNWDGSIA